MSLLARGLPRAEFDVKAIALTRGGSLEEELRQHAVPSRIIGKRLPFDPFVIWELRRWLDANQPQVLHTWGYAANLYGRWAGRKRKHLKIIASDSSVGSVQSGLRLAGDKWVRKATSLFVANTDVVAEHYRQLGYQDVILRVIPPGIPLPTTNPSKREQILKQLDLPPQARVVASVGPLSRESRVDDLIWAFHLVKQLAGNAFLVIVGDGPERQRALDLANHMQCEKAVRIVPQFDHHNDLYGIMNVFWLASERTAIPTRLMSALAAGVPVVCSKTDSTESIVDNGTDGFLVKVGDTAGFAQYTDRLLSDTEMAKRMGQAGRQKIAARFSPENMVQSYSELYRQVVGE